MVVEESLGNGTQKISLRLFIVAETLLCNAREVKSASPQKSEFQQLTFKLAVWGYAGRKLSINSSNLYKTSSVHNIYTKFIELSDG